MMRVGLAVEWRKFRHSPVGWISTAALLGGTLALLLGLSLAIGGGNAQLMAKAGEWATADWHGLVGEAQQIFGAAGLIGFAVVLSWLFAREFSDRTINGLFALPTTLVGQAAAKLVLFLAWSLSVTAVICGVVLLVGLSLGYGFPTAADWWNLAGLFRLGVGTAVIALPAAWLVTVTRSLLAGIGFGIAEVVIAQVAVLSGAGAWAPMVVPTFGALYPQAVGLAQVALSIGYGLLGAAGCLIAWRRLRLDR